MSTYVLDKQLVPNGLDSIGFEVSLPRFEHETLWEYRNRILSEHRAPAGASLLEYVQSLNRKFGFGDLHIASIELKVDGDGVPIAADPHVEVEANKITLYHDYVNGSVEYEFEWSTDSLYFMDTIASALAFSSYFTVTDYTDGNLAAYEASKLRIGNSLKYVSNDFMGESLMYKFLYGHIRDFRASNFGAIQNEQASVAALAASGDYYLDRTNGLLYVFDVAPGYATYSYREFPYRLYYQELRPWLLSDTTANTLLYDLRISESTGLLTERSKLNSVGADVFNSVLAVHPLTWGN